MRKFHYSASLLLFISLIMFSSCQTRGLIYSHFTPVSSQAFEKTNEIHLFFEGELLDFEYEKIGYVSSEGRTRYVDEPEIIDSLKTRAWKSGANGILNISTGSRKSIQTFSGLAVKIQKTPEFKAKYGNGLPCNEEDSVQKKSGISNASRAGIASVGLFIVALIYLR